MEEKKLKRNISELIQYYINNGVHIHDKFVVVEGNDGAGKSTILNYLTGMFDVNTREPGGTTISEKIRRIILSTEHVKEMADSTEAVLYIASRVQHNTQAIKKYLEEGKSILCSRYIQSSMAYQGYARGMGIEKILLANLFMSNLDGTSLYLPKLTIYLDSEPNVIDKRIKERGALDRLELESLEFKIKINEGYKKSLELLKEKFGCEYIIIPHGLSIEDTLKYVKDKIHNNKYGIEIL